TSASGMRWGLTTGARSSRRVAGELNRPLGVGGSSRRIPRSRRRAESSPSHQVEVEAGPMIEFQTVSREFRSLVRRRHALYMFLGSTFAALGIFLQNALHGDLPESLRAIETHLFAFYALVLLVPTLALALRMGRMHAGMIINGVLYARLMQDQDFTAKPDPKRAARHNWV